MKPSLPKGTRDFSPEMMAKRNFIFDTIKKVFQTFGFQPLETPAMENLSVLMGKYGEEGNQLLFKILNSALHEKPEKLPQLSEAFGKMLQSAFTSELITEKGLKYDLTVPFARYVVMNRNDITFPFKRYQIQPVWRGDRPGKGRYREFYQCDADVVGTDSLLCEAEIVLMINSVFEKLGLRNFTIKINNRKILTGIAEMTGASGKEAQLAVAIDKLDKIGKEGVEKELVERGFSIDSIRQLQPIFDLSGTFEEKTAWLQTAFANSETGRTGIAELQRVMALVQSFGLENTHLELDISLARGLSYYTGAIFEVKANDVQMGSICGGGRYDNLTGTFGLPGVSGVGISFGIDRIYDVLEELHLFPENSGVSTQVMFATFDENTFQYSLSLLAQLRQQGIAAEIYPDTPRLKKQLDYANARHIPFVIVIGEDEMNTGNLTLKNMQTGDQEKLNFAELLSRFVVNQ